MLEFARICTHEYFVEKMATTGFVQLKSVVDAIEKRIDSSVQKCEEMNQS